MVMCGLSFYTATTTAASISSARSGRPCSRRPLHARRWNGCWRKRGIQSMISQTKLGHERLARDEAAQQAETAKREVELALAAAREDLETERTLRRDAEAQRDMAIAGRQQAQARHSQASLVEQPASAAQQLRPRGRPPKLTPEQSELVEWWKPGWKEKYRGK